jgi:uncharacterized protein involved in outer membrane biogenesis
MMKKALVALLILVALVAGALFWVYESLDVLVKFTLEHYGPDVAGVTVRVGHVEISPQDGRGMLKAIEIGNPPGFSATHAAKLGEVRVALDPATIRAPIVRVREIAIEAPLIVYERGSKGTNLDAIQRNIEGYVARNVPVSESGDKSAGAPSGARHLFVIDRLAIRGAKVTMTNTALRGQGITFDLPDIELRDLGKRQGGLTASQVAGIVTNTLIARIGQRVLTNIDLLRKGGVEGAIDALKGLIR